VASNAFYIQQAERLKRQTVGGGGHALEVEGGGEAAESARAGGSEGDIKESEGHSDQGDSQSRRGMEHVMTRRGMEHDKEDSESHHKPSGDSQSHHKPPMLHAPASPAGTNTAAQTAADTAPALLQASPPGTHSHTE
jgi:hypothetical protein